MTRTPGFIHSKNWSTNHGTGTWLWAAAIGLALSVFFPSTSQGEQLIYFEPHTGFSEVVDTENPGKYAKLPGPPHAVIGGSGPSRAGGNLTFVVTYADVILNNGIGFDSALFGAARRHTAETVLIYVNDVLNEVTGAVIEIDFDVSETDGTGFLASAGTLYMATAGFSNGLAFLHITSGPDPSPPNPDIVVGVDFGFKWNYDLGSPSSDELDLYTVLLHEYTHGLGYASLSDAAGLSVISGTNPGKYGVYAQLTESDDAGPVGTGSSTAIWTGAGSFTGLVADLTGDALVFVGTNAVTAFGSNPRINSGSPFMSGSSLSHWDFAVGSAVMVPGIASGAEKRTYSAFEIGALVDLGYSAAAAPPPPPPVPLHIEPLLAILMALFGGVCLRVMAKSKRESPLEEDGKP